MGGAAGGRLAAAVTAAGGLGMVGMGSAGSTTLLEAELRHVRGTFGIGLVHWVTRKEAGLLDAALAARPALLSVSFTDEWSWVERAHDGLRRAQGDVVLVRAPTEDDGDANLPVLWVGWCH